MRAKAADLVPLSDGKFECARGDVIAGGGSPQDGWPHSGKVEFQEVAACYRPGLPPVLTQLSFTIEVGLTFT